MTFCEKIRDAMLEEYKDVIKYNVMSMTAEKEYKGILKDIANDEWSHAEMLKKILYETDATLNQTELCAREEALNSMNKE